MAISGTIKGLLAICGKKQNELAEAFGMSKQTMSNKMARESWSAADLVKVAAFCGCKVGIILPDGQQLILDGETE